MRFVGLDLKEIEFPEFIRFWNRCYKYPLDHLYTERISKARFTGTDLTRLFEWKNGGKLSKRKQKTLRRVLERLDKVNSLKKGFYLTEFQRDFRDLSVMWKLFLLHITAPGNYPFFDQSICRAFIFLKESLLTEGLPEGDEVEKLFFDEYVEFYHNHLPKAGSSKEFDQAFWAFGRFLESEYGSAICGHA